MELLRPVFTYLEASIVKSSRIALSKKLGKKPVVKTQTFILLNLSFLAICTAAAGAPAPQKSSNQQGRQQNSPNTSDSAPDTSGTQRQTRSSDTYKVDAFGATLFAAPSATSAQLADIPEGVTLVPLAKESYFIRVIYAGKSGWVSTAGLEWNMAVPSAGLATAHQGFRVVDGKYRYFFGLTNRGVQPYRGEFTVRLYAGKIEIPLRGVGFLSREGVYLYKPEDVTPNGYPLDPGDVIQPSQVRAYYLVADALATRYLFQTVQGKIEGKIGERIGK